MHLSHKFGAPKATHLARLFFVSFFYATRVICAEPSESFRVYFTTDSVMLSHEANLIVSDIYKVYSHDTYRRIVIEGYTDTVGTKRHNYKLSKRRADALITALRNVGISRSDFTVKWYGESSLLYPTPDNFSEPYNRCVVITLSK